MAEIIKLQGVVCYREDTLNNWQTNNPVLYKGEASIVRDGEDGRWLKIGDGTTPWNDLPYKLGPKGENGKDAVTDQTYSPESENAQSGKAIAQVLANTGGTWEKIVDMTTTEEANGIIAAATEFPKLAKCKEFIARIIYQPVETSVDYGAAYLFFNNKTSAIFRFASTKPSIATTEQRCHCIVADGLVFSTATYQLAGYGSVTTSSNMLIGDRFVNDIFNITYCLNEKDALIPIGTQIIIYGKVEG